jgi:ribonuclease VapC
MVIDASALVALIAGEPEAAAFARVLDRQSAAFTSPVSVFETVAALVRLRACSVSDARVALDDLLNEANIAISPVTPEIGEAAVTAFDRYGKGRHPAALNMGNCFTYALARTLRMPLLFKGDDFSRTDLERAV